MNYQVLVSVGIPTYNRPEGLRSTLKHITEQTYKNIEIIISDNMSTDPEVSKVISEFIINDSRIKCFYQKKNLGALENFKYVFNNSSGKYFMWAADDDKWLPTFIETTTAFLESNPAYVAVSMEAQYFNGNHKFSFFPEGEPFYDFYSQDVLERLKFVLTHNYGNLIYGLYRKNVLCKNDIIFAYNEIPFFLQVFEQGNWKVLQNIGLYKQTVVSTYMQAKWEMQGGKLCRKFNLNYIKSIISSYQYHKLAFYDISSSLNTLSIQKTDKEKLKKILREKLIGHFISLLLGFKKAS